MRTIQSVVEGDGEVDALPVLLRKVLHEIHGRYDIGVGKPVKTNGRGKLETQLKKFLRYAERKPGCAGVLLLLDSDDDCPVTLAKQLAGSAKKSVSKPVVVVCAQRKYETWFLVSFGTIKGAFDIPESVSLQGNPEGVSDAKKWLSSQMPHGQAYKETAHQARMTDRIDIELAKTDSRSFQRLCHAVEQLVEAIDGQEVTITP